VQINSSWPIWLTLNAIWFLWCNLISMIYFHFDLNTISHQIDEFNSNETNDNIIFILIYAFLMDIPLCEVAFILIFFSPSWFFSWNKMWKWVEYLNLCIYVVLFKGYIWIYYENEVNIFATFNKICEFKL
jgi:hypothetical protein